MATDREANVEEERTPYLSLVSNPLLREIADEAFRVLGHDSAHPYREKAPIVSQAITWPLYRTSRPPMRTC